MLAAERQRRNQRQMERRAKPARRSSRFMYPKTAARRLHQSRSAMKNQNPQNGHLMARFDWGFGAICFGASPVAAVFGSAPGSATSPKHRIHSNPAPPAASSKQDISTLLGIGHFYFALTMRAANACCKCCAANSCCGAGSWLSWPPRPRLREYTNHERICRNNCCSRNASVRKP